MAAVELERVSKRFGTVRVVEELSLRIEEGEFFTFVGPSGCGKSTLLGLIAGLEAPSAGEIRFDGEAVTRLAPRERDVAMVFQSYALYPHMSVAENIGFPLRMRGRPRVEIDAAVRDVARALELEPLLARRPRELSGGQRQRVALGRALVRRPRVFLMDEPLSNLDARLRLETRAELKRLHTQYGITTIYVTHDQEEAMALSDRVALLEHGRIAQCGPPLELYRDPASLYVAGFIGSPPINVLDADALADRLALPPERAPGALLAAVRPADVSVSPTSVAGALEAEVMLCEPTGGELWVAGRWRDQRLVGRAQPGASLRPGGTAYFGLPAEGVHFFDRESGQRVRWPGDR